jgi:N-carbamoylputrescine amidase
MDVIRISLLHLALAPGLLKINFSAVEHGISIAAERGADLVVTPELCISGYQFTDRIGTDWIDSHPDRWTAGVCDLARLHRIVIIMGHVECDAGRLYNSAFLIDRDGSIIGHHRKINAPAEPWASVGEQAVPTLWNGISIGMLICSDAYPKRIAEQLRSAGAQLLISPCAWGPGLHGPEGEWESRSAENGMPLIVCNRTGRETTLSFSKAESLVIKNGKRLLAHSSETSAVLMFDWDMVNMLPRSKQFHAAYLE